VFIGKILSGGVDGEKAKGGDEWNRNAEEWKKWLAVYAERIVKAEEKEAWADKLQISSSSSSGSDQAGTETTLPSATDVENEGTTRRIDEARKKAMLSVNPRFVIRQWVLEEVIGKVEKDVDRFAANSSTPGSDDTGSSQRWAGRRILAKVMHMASNPYEPWGAEKDPLEAVSAEEGKEEEVSEEEKEERRFCGLGEKKYLGFQCSCSS
jgi:uncharacterized protein YdiU (UPF0061 family)